VIKYKATVDPPFSVRLASRGRLLVDDWVRQCAPPFARLLSSGNNDSGRATFVGASNDHGIRNVGETLAHYFVIALGRD